MMVLALALPALRGVKIDVLGRVGVAGKTHRKFAALEQRKKIGDIDQPVVILLGVDDVDDGDVHDDDDQRLGRRPRQRLFDEFELASVDAAFVEAPAFRPFRIVAEIVDVVEHQEQGFRVEKGVIIGAIDPLERFARQRAVGRLEVEVVIAADVPPRQADGADDAVVATVEREIVEHDVAGGEAEFGGRPGERLDHILANVIDLDLRLRLRIREQHDLEGVGLLLRANDEIDGNGQRAGRRDAGEGQVERGRRAVGAVQIIEARRAGLRVDRDHIAGGLDEEKHARGGGGQAPAAVRVSGDDLAAVGDQRACEPRAARAVALDIDDAGRLGGNVSGGRRSGERGGGAGKADAQRVSAGKVDAFGHAGLPVRYGVSSKSA